MRNTPDLIALDLDNTMYAYEPCHRGAMSAVSHELQSRFDLPRAKWNIPYEQSRASVKSRLGEVASSHSRLAYFKGMLEYLGMQSQIEVALQLENLYWGEFIRQMKKSQNLDRFLETAREKGIPVVVITDLTTGIQIRKLHKLGITDMLSGLVTSEEVGADKPDLRFRDYIINQLGISGDYWWVVGDDKEKDGRFAQNLPNSDFLHVSAGGYSATNFGQLSQLLKKDSFE
jgi:HAD superfamily hydrolase (TIGR01549 family)